MRGAFFQGVLTKPIEYAILEELYCGNIPPDVKFYGKDTPFAKLARLRERNREKLLESLNESEK